MKVKRWAGNIFFGTVAILQLWATAGHACAQEAPAGENQALRLASLWSGAPQRQTPHPAVVRVIAVDQDSMSLGSGTLVDANEDYGLVITNWHVVRDAVGPVEVVFADGFHSMARVVRTDKEWDLAALLIWKPPAVTPVTISTVPPRPGEMLTIAGYGKGDYKMQSGPCTEYLSPAPGRPAEIVELAAAARHGDSGGPIFNNRGELAGVLFGEGGGHTDGSYGGRVNQFLQRTALDLKTLQPASTEQNRATAVAANQIKSNGWVQPQAKFEGGIGSSQDDGGSIAWSNTPTTQIAMRSGSGSPTPTIDVQAGRPLALPAEPAQKMARADSMAPLKSTGFVWGDELKTFLASFGAAAMALHLLRWIAGR
ncbi:MAG TPA: serine protease [Pirellulales bacterium]|nr:serine protease [Pirellulales bacterium]